MIKFFRKIRQQLLTENKPASPAGRFSKYLIYAIGEIILVVIGILIALQINNWNELRKQNKQEHLYLERLIVENKQDLVTFEKSIEDLNKGNQTIKDMGEALNDNGQDSLLLIRVNDYLTFGCHYPFFNPSTSTFEDLSSTGNLGVIKDTDLRDLIVSHYANYKFTESNFEVNTNWALPIDAPLYTETDILKYESTADFLFGKSTIAIAGSDLRKNKDRYIRNAAVHYWVNTDCIDMLKEVSDETARLIERLEFELKKED